MRTLICLAAFIGVLLSTACGDKQITNEGSSSPSTSDGSEFGECESAGREKVDELFAALSESSTAQVERMFPAAMPGWQLQLAPGLLDAARWAEANSIPDLRGQPGVAELPEFNAFRSSEIAGVGLNSRAWSSTVT